MSIYTAILRPILFRLNAEQAHEFALAVLARTHPTCLRMVFGRKNSQSLAREVFGLKFCNPVGLAAGMDKNAVALPAWEALGFGFVEIGTITSRAQPGNPKPRLFRYPAHKALINRMGFNNLGAEAIASRLSHLRTSGRWPGIPVGINLGKSKTTPLNEAAADYRASMQALADFGDYFVINVSSPNTPKLRDLQKTQALQTIAEAVTTEAQNKPVLVKIAPDLSNDDACAVAEMAHDIGLAGLIATNTTLDHSSLPPASDESGGLSGTPLCERSTDLLHQLAAASPLPLVASGGVMDAASAKEKFAAGARLVQLYTGFVYSGPGLISEILQSMEKFDRDQSSPTTHK